MDYNDSTTVDFDNLDDPNEAAKLQKLLKLQKYKKNIIEQSEFDEKYKDLFTVQQNMDQDALRELAKEYMG